MSGELEVRSKIYHGTAAFASFHYVGCIYDCLVFGLCTVHCISASTDVYTVSFGEAKKPWVKNLF